MSNCGCVSFFSSAVVVVVGTIAVRCCSGRGNEGDWQNHGKGEDDQGNTADKASNVEAESHFAMGCSSSIVTTTIIILCLSNEEMEWCVNTGKCTYVACMY